MNLIFAWILTIIIEWGVFCLFFRKDYLKLIGYSILINSITNPLLNFLLLFGINIILLEFLVFAVEIFLIKLLFDLRWKTSAILSFCANLSSFLIGIALGRFI